MADPGTRSRLGLRGRLAASIALILLVTLTAAFFAAYHRTASDLRSKIDDDLSQTSASLASSLERVGPNRGDQQRVADRFVAANSFGPSAQLLVVSIPAGELSTNEPELLGLVHDEDDDPDRADEKSLGRQIQATRAGYTELQIGEAGRVRLLTQTVPLVGGGEATIRVGEPLAQVDRTLDGLNRTFLVIGLIALLAGAGVAYLLAARTTRPLRRMAETAGGIDSGDLALRMDAGTSRDEVEALAVSFNHMLERLQGSFVRQQAFVADASHELRTPLTIIRGQIEVLARGPNPSARDVDRVSRQVMPALGRMERLVTDLLLLAKTDEGIHLNSQIISVPGLINAHVEAFEAIADRRLETGPMAAGTIKGDPDRIGQVLSNLISNAVEHTRPDGRVMVSAAAAGDRLTISVEDDGPGIPPSERQLVFNRFHRADESRTRRHGGSGLGLAIALALIEAHGGSIRAGDSTLGGARFDVDLPGYLP